MIDVRGYPCALVGQGLSRRTRYDGEVAIGMRDGSGFVDRRQNRGTQNRGIGIGGRIRAAIAAAALATLIGSSPVGAAGGTPRWTQPYSGQVLAYDGSIGHLLVLAADGGVTVVNASTGARLGQGSVGESGTWRAGVVDAQGGRAFFPFTSSAGNARVVIVDTGTGRVLSTVSLPGAARQLAEDPGTSRIYIAGTDPAGTITILDTRSGRVAGTLQVGAPADWIGIDSTAQRISVATTPGPLPAAFDPAEPAQPGTLRIVDLVTQKTVSTIRIGRNPGGLAVDPASGHVFVTNTLDHTISVVDGRSGSVIATTGANAAPEEIAIDPANNRATILCQGWHLDPSRLGQGVPLIVAGAVDVLDTATGTGVLRIPLRAPGTTLALDRQTGRVFAGVSHAPTSGSVRVLSLGARPIIGTIRLAGGATPTALAVDESGGRIFVLVTGSATPGMDGGYVSMLEESRL